MKVQFAGALGIPRQRIGGKATTNERRSAPGRREGIAAPAVARVAVAQGKRLRLPWVTPSASVPPR